MGLYVKQYPVTRAIAEDHGMWWGLIFRACRDCELDGGEPLEHDATIRFLDPTDSEQVHWIEPGTPTDMLIAMVEVPTED